MLAGMIARPLATSSRTNSGVISLGIAAPHACPGCWNFRLSRGALADISTDSRTACSFMFSRIAMNSISGVIPPWRA